MRPGFSSHHLQFHEKPRQRVVVRLVGNDSGSWQLGDIGSRHNVHGGGGKPFCESPDLSCCAVWKSGTDGVGAGRARRNAGCSLGDEMAPLRPGLRQGGLARVPKRDQRRCGLCVKRRSLPPRRQAEEAPLPPELCKFG